MPEVSPKAIVANPAGLADDVRVGPFSCLGPEVVVEAGTVIANHVTVLGKTRIGTNCRLFPGCVVGIAPVGVDERSAGGCVVGPRNTIREYVTIESGRGATGPGSVLGPNNLLMAGCQVGHDAVLEGDGIFPNYTRIQHHAGIERFVRSSAFVTIQPYATIGAYTMVTGYVSVERDAPPFAIVEGSPFRVRGVNAENLRRCKVPEDAVAVLRKAFHVLFEADAPFPSEELLRSVERDFDGEQVRFLIGSLRASAASPHGLRRLPAGEGPAAHTA